MRAHDLLMWNLTVSFMSDNRKRSSMASQLCRYNNYHKYKDYIREMEILKPNIV